MMAKSFYHPQCLLFFYFREFLCKVVEFKGILQIVESIDDSFQTRSAILQEIRGTATSLISSEPQ